MKWRTPSTRTRWWRRRIKWIWMRWRVSGLRSLLSDWEQRSKMISNDMCLYLIIIVRCLRVQMWMIFYGYWYIDRHVICQNKIHIRLNLTDNWLSQHYYYLITRSPYNNRTCLFFTLSFILRKRTKDNASTTNKREPFIAKSYYLCHYNHSTLPNTLHPQPLLMCSWLNDLKHRKTLL